MNEDLHHAQTDYQRIESVIRFLENNFQQQPDLKEISEHIGLSEFHLQRLFTRWVGISPKRFLQFLTKEYAKNLLRQSKDILTVSLQSGLSGPGRLHDLFVQCEAVTPGEYKRQGGGINIFYGKHTSSFGDYLLAMTERGICGLYFLRQGNEQIYVCRLQQDWPGAVIDKNQQKTSELAKMIFNPALWKKDKPLPLLIKGTNFQIKVWEALLKIPQGRVVAYEDIAGFIGKPKAVRAVGSAVAKNPVSYLIPCHRVIRKYGDTGNYLGGRERKKAILAWEAAKIMQ